MKTRTLLLVCTIPAILCSTTQAKIIYVDDDRPADFNNIQDAINYADINDTVFVSEGTYYENIEMKNGISLVGAGAENTIIDGGKKGHVVIFNLANGEIKGFTITNSGTKPGYLSGIFLSQSFVKIENNLIINNNGGVSVTSNSYAEIKNNKIMNNTGWSNVFLDTASRALIENNIISGSPFLGIDGSQGTITVVNNTIVNNNLSVVYKPGPNQVCIDNIIAYNQYGILIEGDSKLSMFKISNNDVWKNSISNYWYEWGSVCNIEDPCCIPQGYSGPFEPQPGTGEISSDPSFVDPNHGDYHLKSQAGRFDPKSQTWMYDDVTSPCIDTGEPNSPIGYETFPNGGYINMGAYGGTAEASKSYFGKPVCDTIVAGDINGDCKVDEADLEILMLHWLENHNP